MRIRRKGGSRIPISKNSVSNYYQIPYDLLLEEAKRDKKNRVVKMIKEREEERRRQILLKDYMLLKK